MKRAILLTVFSLLVLSLSAGSILYVKQGGNGDGSSWSNPMGEVQQALQAAKYGDQIWVATGKYLPTQGNDRSASFIISDGVQLFGGFAGYENDVDERNWKLNQTILSGEIASPSIEDNSYTVVYTKNASANTIIDGFVITGGFSNVTAARADRKRCGAGWYNDGSNGTSNPTIVNCIFKNNYSRDGAGLYNYAQNGVASPTLRNCQFLANRADLDGGAIYNDGTMGVSSPIIDNCQFELNEATYGAGILNMGNQGEAMPMVMNCNFVDNLSYIKQGSIYNSKEGTGISEAITKNCRFSESTSSASKVDETAQSSKK
ncbi:MAG: hypothetical protein IPJ74_14015 [Saprospiraceae bacterium]|nr:hypothetical protein [Saprospiraceae bacterium]